MSYLDFCAASMTTISISGEELALKRKLLRAFTAALNTSSEENLEARDWLAGVPEDRPEFHAVLALLDQGAGQAFARIPGAVEAWLLGVSQNAYFFATDDGHSTMGSDWTSWRLQYARPCWNEAWSCGCPPS